MFSSLKTYFSEINERQLVYIWLAFCFFAMTYNMGEVPPYHSDENFYVESSRNMVESGDYLTPVYNDKKRFAKPILYYWLVSASYKIFGVNLVAARLVSALFGCLTIGLLYLISCRLFDERTAFYSILILPATFLHFQISRWATTDIVMNFFILLALYYFVRVWQSDFKEKKNIYLFYVSMALGFMTKGPPAVIIPGLVAIFFILATKRKGALAQLLIGRGLMIVLLVNLPWFATMYYLHGDEFKNHIVGAEIEGRLAHNTPFSFYYFGVVIRYQLPWSLFFLAAVFHQFGLYSYSLAPVSGLSEYLRKLPGIFMDRFKLLFSRENESILICYIWILVCLVLFTLVRTEHSRYMLPASPAIALLTARFFADLEKFPRELFWRGYKTPAVLTGIIFLLIALSSFVTLNVLNSIYDIPLKVYIFPVIVFLGGFYVLKLRQVRPQRKQVLAISFSLVIAFSILSGDLLSHVSRYPMKLFSEKVLTEKFSGVLAVYQLGSHRARLGVLTGQKVSKLYIPEHVEEIMAKGEKVWVVMREKDFKSKFSKDSWQIIAEDVAWLPGRVDWERIKELWVKAQEDGISNFTEKVYLLSNK